MSTADEIRPRAEWLAEARREIGFARWLASDPAGFIKGAWLNALPFNRAIERARIYRLLARNPSRSYADVSYEVYS